MKKPKPRLVSIKEIAAALNLTTRRIHQLVQGGLPKALRGRYDRDECVGWYIRYLQTLVDRKAIVDKGGKVFASEREARLWNLRADADLKEIELSREHSQLVAIADVEKEFADLITTTKARVMAVAPQLAPDLVGETRA